MYDVRQTAIPGCLEILPEVRRDVRGRFVKAISAAWFSERRLATNFQEQYYSVSHRNVLRGLHFQTPPHEHVKVLYCANGSVLDAFVDLRAGSPAFGQHALVELTAEKGNVLYLPPGVAHGFLATSDEALMVYNVTSGYAPAHDTGVLWSGAGITWPFGITPLVSERDAAFPTLAEFRTPFVFDGPSQIQIR